jgi:tetratricopeptide (TPR) repeat protein
MRFAAALLPFWHARAHLAEGRDRLTQVLRLVGRPEQLDLRARTMFALGTMLYSLGDPAGSCAMHVDVLDAYRTIGDRRGVAIAWNAVGVCQRAQGRHRRASEAFEEALSVWRELGDDRAAAQMLSNLAAVAADQGDHARARRLYQEVRALFDRLGDRAGAAWTVDFEAHVAEAQGDLEAARALFREVLLQFLAINDAWGTGDSLLALGHLACDGDRATARRWFVQAHEVFANAGDQRGLARVIEAFARLAADDRNASRALTLAGAADALRQTLNVPMPRADRGRLDRALAAVRLGPDAQGVGPAWVEGWTMTADEAIRFALAG